MQPDFCVRSPRGGRISLSAALLAVVAAGCGAGQPQFAARDDVKDLMPEARSYVHELLEDNFGTPTHPVAWERLPLHFHAASGSVATVTEGNPAELTLTPPPAADSEEEPATGGFEQWLSVVADDPKTKRGGMEVLFVSGAIFDETHQAQLTDEAARADKAAVQSFWVRSFDPATYKLVLSEAPAKAPAPGDRIIIGPGEMLKRGRMLYAEHCQHCHGVSGDGNGPTAQYLNPLPRDYRSAIFKFTSTKTPIRAQRGDLAHIIEEGIPGTYMPSFKLLLPEESAALVEYVLWLSCRGEAELRRYKALVGDFSTEAFNENRQAVQASFAEAFSQQFATDFDDETNDIAGKWIEAAATEEVVVPAANRTPVSVESIARGREIFKSETAKCASCHGDAGKGDGPQTLAVQKDANGKDRDVPGLFDDWSHPIRPRDLTSGIYRGGRRPIDIYRRIYAGIKGTPMTGFGSSLSNEQIWDLVNYVMSIPFEQRKPGEGPFVATKDSGVGIQDPGVAPAGDTSASDTHTAAN